jgi:uncharacterized protein (DUF1697 family)
VNTVLHRYVAFLRAINVAGHAIVSMTDLRDAFADAGCLSVRTYIQSGNVIFDSAGVAEAVLFQRIRSQVRALIGAEPGIVFRTARQVDALVRSAPFKALGTGPALKLYVVCLAEKPSVRPRFPLRLPKEALEAVGMKGLDVLVVSRRKPSGFYGFPNNFIEKELGVPATSRNWTTMTKMAGLLRT